MISALAIHNLGQPEMIRRVCGELLFGLSFPSLFDVTQLPVRKVYYNLVITGLSIAVAFLIGTIEIIGLLSTELHIHGRIWDFMANFNINRAGFTIAGLFVVVWTIAIGYWKRANTHP